MSYLLDRLEPRVRAQLAADLPRRAARQLDHVGGEVEVAADQRGADAVGVDRGADLDEAFDLLRVEAAGDDDLHPLVGGRVEAVADRLGGLRGDPAEALGVGAGGGGGGGGGGAGGSTSITWGGGGPPAPRGPPPARRRPSPPRRPSRCGS